MWRICFSLLLLMVPSAARAQTTAQQIERAVSMYQQFDVEGARPILSRIVSPGYLQPVSLEERVKAYKYLGASYAVLANRDSAISFFIAALDFDPFTDLDATEFSASELSAFAEARGKIFKVAVRPVATTLVTPGDDSTAVKFSLITTQRANLTVHLRRLTGDTTPELLYSGNSEGLREILWSGMRRTGSRAGNWADTGTYVFRVEATSGNSVQPAQELFRIDHSFEPLEDTIPELEDSRLLPAQYPPMAPWWDLAKGAIVGLGAFALPTALMSTDLKWQTHGMAATGIGVLGGAISFGYRRQNRNIPENVRDNQRRQNVRAAFNTAVRARNAQRLAQTKLYVAPVAGFGR